METVDVLTTNSERRYFYATILAILAIFGANFLAWGTRPWDYGDLDEAGWISCVYFYHLAFHDGDFHSSQWKSVDCLDHPPLMKFLLGAVLDLQGFRVDSISLREKTMGEMTPEQAPRLFEELRAQLPPRLFWTGRALSTLFMSLAAFLLFLIARRCFGSRAALLSTIVFSSSSLTRYYAVLIMSDSLLIFLLLLATWLQLRLVESLDMSHRRVWPLALGLAISCALFFNTKILGVAEVGIAGLAIVGWCLFRHRFVHSIPSETWRGVLRNGIWFLLCFTFLAVALNPSYYTRPIQFARASLQWRNLVIQSQQALIPQISLPNVLVKASGLVSSFGYVGLRPWPNIPSSEHNIGWTVRRREESIPLRAARDAIGLFLVFCTSLGVFQTRFAWRRNKREVFVFGLNVLAWAAVVWYCFQHNLARYTFPAFPFLCVFTGAGLHKCLTIFQSPTTKVNAPSRKRRRFWFTPLLEKRSVGEGNTRLQVGASLLITAFLVAVFLAGNIDSFHSAHPDWVDNKRRSAPSQEWFDARFEEIAHSIQR